MISKSEKRTIILRTKDDVNQFFVDNNIHDTDREYMWECPLCDAKNYGAYFSHMTPCAECKKYAHPVLSKFKDAPYDKKKEKERLSEKNKLLAEYEDITGEIEDLERRKNKIDAKLKAMGY